MDVYCELGSCPDSVATFTHAGPAPAELTPTAQLAKAKETHLRISRPQEKPNIAGCASRARFKHRKETVTIAAALSAGYRKGDRHWDLMRGFLTLRNLALDSPTASPGQLVSNAGCVVHAEWRHARLVLLFSEKEGAFSLHQLALCLSS